MAFSLKSALNKNMVHTKMLESQLMNRQNNFDFIRFVAAAMVFFSHSWPLTTGSNQVEPLAVVTRYQLDFGALAVDIFFIVSGFLVTQSFMRSQSVVRFAKARVLRIVPGLCVVVVLLECVLGPLVTSEPLRVYWSHFPFPSFLRDYLPGVFSHNPFPGAVDGSLWTIKFEVLCYILVAILGSMVLLSNVFVVTALWGFSMTPFATDYSLGLLPFFSTGILFYVLRRRVPVNGGVAAVSLLLLVGSVCANVSHWVVPITLGYLVLWFVYSPKIRLSGFAKYGDWSYGIYIYAFPIQQILVEYLKVSHPLELFSLSLPITLSLAALSWHMIEKKALRLKEISIREVLHLSKRWNTSAQRLD